MPGLFGPAGQQPYPDPVDFIAPVGQQPCLDFSGRQDSNHIRIPFILYTCVDIYIYVSFIFGSNGASIMKNAWNMILLIVPLEVYSVPHSRDGCPV